MGWIKVNEGFKEPPIEWLALVISVKHAQKLHAW